MPQNDQEQTRKIHGQASWELASNATRLAITCLGGHMAPVGFKLGSRWIEPYSVAPWAEEILGSEIPDMLRVLRGDFFCAPFGGNETPYRGENHPPHGESANAPWRFVGREMECTSSGLRLALSTKIRQGRIEKFLQVRDNEPAVYCRHKLEGMTGPMNLGHHAMLKFPQTGGNISTSPIAFAQVAPRPFEIPASRGYQSLLPSAEFKRLERVPTVFGGFEDISRYPARRGYEDLVMLVHASQQNFAWTAVTFPKEGYLWFSLKDPSVLRSTIFWISNGGRYYPPWNGRHCDVMGLEEVTSYFHYGLAESARANPVSKRGYPTTLKLKPTKPLIVSTIMGVAEIPSGFEKVRSIIPSKGFVTITSTAGHRIKASLDTGFLKHQPL